MTFLPKDYATPSTANYMKWQEGKNKFRILSGAITGFEYWNTSKKPVRSPDPIASPKDIQPGTQVKFFWAMVVWNYQDERVQILEITQKTIIDTIETLYNDDDWGEPEKYDITVTKSGSGMDTSYTIMPTAPKPIAPEVIEAYKARKVNLKALYEGADPFAGEKPEAQKEAAAYPPPIDPNGIPF